MSSKLGVDETQNVPLYVQLREQMRSLAGELGRDDQFPSESDCAVATGLSRITVRRALSDLTHEKVLYTKRGRGTFVGAGHVEEALQTPEGFSRVMIRAGYEPSSLVRSAVLVGATDVVASRLGLMPGDPVFALNRVRLMSGQPCMVETAYLPSAPLDRFLDQDLARSLYDLLADTYDIRIASGTERIFAVKVGENEASELHLETGEAVLFTERITWSDSGYPIEYTERTARADLMAFRVNLGSGSRLIARADARRAGHASEAIHGVSAS